MTAALAWTGRKSPTHPPNPVPDVSLRNVTCRSITWTILTWGWGGGQGLGAAPVHRGRLREAGCASALCPKPHVPGVGLSRQGHRVTRHVPTVAVTLRTNRCFQCACTQPTFTVYRHSTGRPRVEMNRRSLALARLPWGDPASVCGPSTASMSLGGWVSGAGGSLPTTVWGMCLGSVSCPPSQPHGGSFVRHAVPSMAPLGLGDHVEKVFLNRPHPESPTVGTEAGAGNRPQEDPSDRPNTTLRSGLWAWKPALGGQRWGAPLPLGLQRPHHQGPVRFAPVFPVAWGHRCTGAALHPARSPNIKTQGACSQ